MAHKALTSGNTAFKAHHDRPTARDDSRLQTKKMLGVRDWYRIMRKVVR